MEKVHTTELPIEQIQLNDIKMHTTNFSIKYNSRGIIILITQTARIKTLLQHIWHGNIWLINKDM